MWTAITAAGTVPRFSDPAPRLWHELTPSRSALAVPRDESARRHEIEASAAVAHGRFAAQAVGHQAELGHYAVVSHGKLWLPASTLTAAAAARVRPPPPPRAGSDQARPTSTPTTRPETVIAASASDSSSDGSPRVVGIHGSLRTAPVPAGRHQRFPLPREQLTGMERYRLVARNWVFCPRGAARRETSALRFHGVHVPRSGGRPTQRWRVIENAVQQLPPDRIGVARLIGLSGVGRC